MQRPFLTQMERTVTQPQGNASLVKFSDYTNVGGVMFPEKIIDRES